MLKKCSSFADVRASFLRPYKHVTRAHSARYAQENQGRVAKGRERGTGKKGRGKKKATGEPWASGEGREARSEGTHIAREQYVRHTPNHTSGARGRKKRKPSLFLICICNVFKNGFLPNYVLPKMGST